MWMEIFKKSLLNSWEKNKLAKQIKPFEKILKSMEELSRHNIIRILKKKIEKALHYLNVNSLRFKNICFSFNVDLNNKSIYTFY